MMDIGLAPRVLAGLEMLVKVIVMDLAVPANDEVARSLRSIARGAGARLWLPASWSQLVDVALDQFMKRNEQFQSTAAVRKAMSVALCRSTILFLKAFCFNIGRQNIVIGRG